MKEKLTYVRSILSQEIVIISTDRLKNKFLQKLGAHRKFFSRRQWLIKYISERELADKLQKLRNANFMFSGGHTGWSPVDVFCYLRDKEYVKGKIINIEWEGSGKARVKEQ